jgi:hypothetical protein
MEEVSGDKKGVTLMDHLRRGERIRVSLREWTLGHISTWLSPRFVTFNMKASICGPVGSYLRIDDPTARATIKQVGSTIDKAVYCRAVQHHNKRVQRIPFLEYGFDRGWHCHVIFDKPQRYEDRAFEQLVADVWIASPWGASLDYRLADDGAAGYVTKGRSKSEFEMWSDTLVVEAVVLDTK